MAFLFSSWIERSMLLILMTLINAPLSLVRRLPLLLKLLMSQLLLICHLLLKRLLWGIKLTALPDWLLLCRRSRRDTPVLLSGWRSPLLPRLVWQSIWLLLLGVPSIPFLRGPNGRTRRVLAWHRQLGAGMRYRLCAVLVAVLLALSNSVLNRLATQAIFDISFFFFSSLNGADQSCALLRVPVRVGCHMYERRTCHTSNELLLTRWQLSCEVSRRIQNDLGSARLWAGRHVSRQWNLSTMWLDGPFSRRIPGYTWRCDGTRWFPAVRVDWGNSAGCCTLLHKLFWCYDLLIAWASATNGCPRLPSNTSSVVTVNRTRRTSVASFRVVHTAAWRLLVHVAQTFWRIGIYNRMRARRTLISRTRGEPTIRFGPLMHRLRQISTGTGPAVGPLMRRLRQISTSAGSATGSGPVDPSGAEIYIRNIEIWL